MRLIEDSITKNLHNQLKEDFFNPGKYFKLLQELQDEMCDLDNWNTSSQEERDAMVRPCLQEFWNKYKEYMDESDIEALFDDMEDSNYHTEYRILRDIIDKDAYKLDESLPFSHTATIYYGTTENNGDDVGEINCIVDNRDDFLDITDEELHDSFKNDNLTIYNNDLSGKEYMSDIKLFNDKGWLEFKDKDDQGNYHFVITESTKLTEDSKIWSNHDQEEYYSNLSREEMIQEIKDNGWDEEEINGKPILDADDEELRDYLTPYDMDLDYEDYENSILPMIENQCYGDYLVLAGIAANWRGKGEACKAIKVKDLENYFFPNYDAHIQLYCDDQDNLYYTEANHDTPMGGTQMYLYGFLDETSYNNAEKALQKLYDDEDFDMYYFCDWLGYSEAEELIKSGLLKPIKRDPQYIGRVDEETKIELDNKKDLNESVKLEETKKPKKSKKENKEDKRVIMQQGNVTCIKENSSYLVFENESDNEVEHDSEESAMQDFLERVGIDPNDELKETK